MWGCIFTDPYIFVHYLVEQTDTNTFLPDKVLCDVYISISRYVACQRNVLLDPEAADFSRA
jgi:hypothetical protein